MPSGSDKLVYDETSGKLVYDLTSGKLVYDGDWNWPSTIDVTIAGNLVIKVVGTTYTWLPGTVTLNRTGSPYYELEIEEDEPLYATKRIVVYAYNGEIYGYCSYSSGYYTDYYADTFWTKSGYTGRLVSIYGSYSKYGVNLDGKGGEDNLTSFEVV
jgi:hypothetical protein